MSSSTLAARRLGGLSTTGPHTTAVARRVVRERIAAGLDLPDDLPDAERERRIDIAVSAHYRELGRRGGRTPRKAPRPAGNRAERIAEARAEVERGRIERQIAELVDAAPRLTAAQRDRLSSLLRPGAAA